MSPRLTAAIAVMVLSGCLHQPKHNPAGRVVATPADTPASHISMFHRDSACMRPSGICPQPAHGLHCAVLPNEMRVPGQQWWATTVRQGDLQTLEIRELVREGWWILDPSPFRGQILGPVTLMKPAGKVSFWRPLYDEAGREIKALD